MSLSVPMHGSRVRLRRPAWKVWLWNGRTSPRVSISVMQSNSPTVRRAAAEMVPLGTYAGTRGRALPLTGVVLEMSGTDELEFVAEAGFLNAPTLRAVGKRVVLSGPTNREPLVGIRIGIERIATAEQVVTPAKPRKAAGSARVRVFRSQPRQAGATR